MSGIAGIVRADGCEVAEDVLDRIADATTIRGLDGIASWRGGPAGLLRFRTVTTPEALYERQPRPAPSGNIIAFDGRLDNRAELLALLGPAGARLRHAPDDEIAMALFEARGDAFLRDLTGDYALAIWQPGPRRLFCARAPVGWRPFLYTLDHMRFAFASEPRALVVGLDLERRLDESAIAEFLAQRVVTSDATFWQGVHHLPQGSALEYVNGALRRWHWDDMPFDDLSRASEGEHVERFTALFDQALVACTRSSTPVVSQLSGGLDSSSVFSRATQLQRAGTIAQPVAAITMRVPGTPVDESRWSGAVERDLGVTARVVVPRPYNTEGARAWTAATLQLPLRPNNEGTIRNISFDLHARGERVLLTGEGGDELLNGNHAHWPDALRRGQLGLIAREGFGRAGVTPLRAIRSMIMESIGPLLSARRHARVAHRQAWAGTRPDWLRPEWLARTGLYARVAAARPAVTFASIAAQNRYAPVGWPERDLIYRPSLAFAARYGIECRHPLYDVRLLRFCMGAAGGVLFKGDVQRSLLREAMRGTLVEEVRTRTHKTIFNMLTLDALAALYAERPIAQQWPVRLGWVDGDRLDAIWQGYSGWRASDMSGPLPPGQFAALWNTAALDIWLEHGFGL